MLNFVSEKNRPLLLAKGVDENIREVLPEMHLRHKGFLNVYKLLQNLSLYESIVVMILVNNTYLQD